MPRCETWTLTAYSIPDLPPNPSALTSLLFLPPKHHAADNLVDVVARIFSEVVNSRRSIILRGTMRQWRCWYMLRVSVQLYNRQRLRNW